MNGQHIFGGKVFYLYFKRLIIVALVTLSLGCGDNSQNGDSKTITPSDTASASLTIHWHDAPVSKPSNTVRTAPLDCQASGVENVHCEVYDPDGRRLAGGGPWPCTSHGGRVERIPMGVDRIFVVLAEDADGKIRYRGTTPGVAISAGEITVGVVVEAFPFVPTLTSPADAAIVDPAAVALEWAALDNAEEYLVQVADDADFENMVIDQTIADTTFAPADLQPSTRYFWRISAVDPYANIGVASQMGSFTTTDCVYNLSSEAQNVSAAGGVHDVSVTAVSGNCDWAAATTSDWIEISPTSGSDDGIVSITVSANTGAARSAEITIAGQPHSVSQAAGACEYSISPSSQPVSATGGTHEVTITATHTGCDWTAATNSDWITLTTGSGAGSGAVGITAVANTGLARSGQITIAGQTHTVDQAAAACSFTLTPPEVNMSAEGAEYSFDITATHDGCDWDAATSSDWIRLSQGQGRGSETVDVQIMPNTGAARSGEITIPGQIHTVNQAAAACDYTLSPTAQTVYQDGGVYEISISATHVGCEWTAATTSGWIEISPDRGSGDGTVQVTIPAFTGAARSDEIAIAGQTHTVNQIPNTPPTITYEGYTVLAVNSDDYGCFSTASVFRVNLNYTDSENNGPVNIQQADVVLAWDFPGNDDGDGTYRDYDWSSSLQGDGTTGSGRIRQCYVFGSNSYVDVTITIEDQLGATSNPITFQIDRPRNAY